jgi:Arc/MetJ-type ribon-helix-helix transcriptional regulator
MTRVKHTTISIPKSLYKKIERRIKSTGFRSVSEYVIFVLREILAEEKMEKSSIKKSLTKKQEEQIKKRLRALGYL